MTTIALGRFRPGTAFWNVNREWLVTLGGARAVLLEIAHPLIAEGVARHSNYRGDPFGRLLRTMRTMTDLIFADPAGARRAAGHFFGCHRPVRGHLAAAVGPYPAGTPYDARDPFLKLWVLGTLIDSVLKVYELLVAPLTEADREAYYADTLALGQLLGLPRVLMPPTFQDFAGYMDAMLTSDLLAVGDTAHDIVAALYGPPPFGPLARQASFVGIGLLPAGLRSDFGFSWSEGDSRRLAAMAAWARRLRSVLPATLAVHPRALVAEWRRRNLRVASAVDGGRPA
jgi:uncharacterized protein (DUF2236 family)